MKCKRPLRRKEITRHWNCKLQLSFRGVEEEIESNIIEIMLKFQEWNISQQKQKFEIVQVKSIDPADKMTEHWQMQIELIFNSRFDH